MIKFCFRSCTRNVCDVKGLTFKFCDATSSRTSKMAESSVNVESELNKLKRPLENLDSELESKRSHHCAGGTPKFL